MADIDAPLSWRMQQDGYLMQIDQLKAENAGLREQYEAVIADYRSEVAKFRELVRDMWHEGMCECGSRGKCESCMYDYPNRMRELGVEVDDA